MLPPQLLAIPFCSNIRTNKMSNTHTTTPHTPTTTHTDKKDNTDKSDKTDKTDRTDKMFIYIYLSLYI